MRHRVKGRKLKRTASHRKATLIALATSLLKHKKITTTVAKAKELRTFVEPMITKAKNDSVHSRRYVADKIKDKEVVKDLFGDIITKVGDRPGGYTRIILRGQRKGDGAELAFIELVDFSGISKPKAPKKSGTETAEPSGTTESEEAKEGKTAKKAAVKTKKESAPKQKNEKISVKEKKTPKTKAPTPQKKGS
jgi:large subunit ribosomal protein L17